MFLEWPIPLTGNFSPRFHPPFSGGWKRANFTKSVAPIRRRMPMSCLSPPVDVSFETSRNVGAFLIKRGTDPVIRAKAANKRRQLKAQRVKCLRLWRQVRDFRSRRALAVGPAAWR